MDNLSSYELFLYPYDIRTKLNLTTTLNGLADKGFRNGKELQLCKDDNIITFVPPIDKAFSGKDTDFTKDKFTYNTEGDTYTCPDGKTLTTNGTFYDKKDRHGVVTNQYQLYKAPLNDCQNCPFNDKCLSKSQLGYGHGRTIERSEFEEAVEQNDARYNTPEGKTIYKRRQAVVEHPFGTIKRSWGYYYTLLKGTEKVTAEFAFVATTYNLRRAVSIIGIKSLIMKLKAAKGSFVPVVNTIFALIISQLNFYQKIKPLSILENLKTVEVK